MPEDPMLLNHLPAHPLRRSTRSLVAVAAVLLTVLGLVPGLGVGASPAAAATTNSYGSEPIDDILSAAGFYATCGGLSANQLAAMMIAPTIEETGVTPDVAPSPMTLSRWDNKEPLFAFGDFDTPYQGAFFSPGIGLWQFDSAGGWNLTAASAINTQTSAPVAAKVMASRYCASSSTDVETRIRYAWAPWSACASGSLCIELYHQLFDGTNLLVNRLPVSRLGGSVITSCRVDKMGTLPCTYVDPARAEGSKSWTTPLTPQLRQLGMTPLPKPFYVFSKAGREYRYWLRKDTGYGVDIMASKPITANARTSLTWSIVGAGTSLCEVLPTSSDCAPDGTFVVSRQTGAVYRIAGGAPIYVSTWSAFPPNQPVIYADQSVIDKLPPVPFDGTYVVGLPRGDVNVIAGGAPVYVSTFAAVPAGAPIIGIDQHAIDNAGAGGVWNHLRPRPEEGTLLVTHSKGEQYLVTGGAPIYLSTPAALPPGKTAVRIDQAAADNAGAGGLWNHLRAQPVDGTVLIGLQRQEMYVVAGGSPQYIGSIAAIPAGPRTTVDQAAIDNIAQGGPYRHLRAVPLDGTYLQAKGRGDLYVVAGGAPVYLSTFAAVRPGATWTGVDPTAIDQAGGAAPWHHLRAQPADGTIVVGVQRGEWYVMAGGAPIYTSTFAVVPAGATPVNVDVTALDAPGTGVWSHIRRYPRAGTVLRGGPNGYLYTVDAAGRVAYTPGATGIPVLVDAAALMNAGQPRPWNHLAG